MWSLIIFAYTITAVCSQQQNTRRPELYDNGHGWDIRLAVPGEPGGDYPTLNAIPRTSFSCSRKSPGYYADAETGCQVFRVCTLGSTYGFQSFLCPNGTLFNQEVFVCDWWMNVNCQKSQQIFNDYREKFGNLKLGPQLMKDIKKMLTHPMRNPYDKSIIKSNLVVMQEYKPPTGQLFPNGALISGPERPPSNIYIPAKQRQGYFAQNSFTGDLSFAASTPSSQYIPSFNGVRSIGTRDNNVEVLQQQKQYVQPEQNFNSHRGAIQTKNTELINNNGIPESSYNNQRNIHFASQNDQSQRQISQYNNNVNSVNNIKPEQKRISTPTQQLTYVSKQHEQLIHDNNIRQLTRDDNSPIGREARYNLVSPNSPQPAGKTLKFSRIVQKSSSGTPKSRITFKTWIVRPSKSAQLVVEPTPYTYYKPNSPTENRLIVTSLDNPNPTTEKVNFESENVPYVYDKPTPSSKQDLADERTPSIYIPPTEPTLSNRAYSTPKFPVPKQSLLNLPPTTYKPFSQFYVPPSKNSLELSRQYLSPHLQLPETFNYQNARLVATPTSPAIDFTTVTSNVKQTPSFTLTKQSHINTNHNNLSFADILTKEKLDITVNDIVKNTNKILKTASPDIYNQYREDPKIDDTLANNYLSSEFNNEFNEKPVLQPPRALSKNERLIAAPSTDLEPPEPVATINNNHKNSNKLLNLPFFQEPIPTNTIERTVSLKISIPETIAEYLFKNDSQSNSDNLEILKTGSSNYLVLTNSHLDKNNDAGFIPIGKLIWDKNLNISNSQALVYSFLADSIKTAKAYSNIAKQNIISPPSREPYTKNINYEDIGDITNKISQLTSSHYAKDNQKNANLVQSYTSNEKYRDNPEQITELSQKQSTKGRNYHSNYQNTVKNLPNLQYSQIQLNSNDLVETPEKKFEPNNRIYSGQLYKLPVPEVTSKIYNSPNPLQLSQVRQLNDFPMNSQRNIQENKIKKQPNMDVELISSETSPYPPPYRQLLPLTEESTFNIQADAEHILPDNILNTNAGITAQVQDKITGTLPHPLEENKLVTYQKNRSYYLYTKLDDENNDNAPDKNAQSNEVSNIKNAKLIRNNDLINGAEFELFPAIGYELEDERHKQQMLKTLKVNDFRDSKYIESYNQRQGDLVTGVDFTILHPTSRKRAEQYNNVNSILYRGPSSYLAPQSSVGSLRGTQQSKQNARIEQFEENNGYSKTIPASQFTF